MARPGGREKKENRWYVSVNVSLKEKGVNPNRKKYREEGEKARYGEKGGKGRVEGEEGKRKVVLKEKNECQHR